MPTGYLAVSLLLRPTDELAVLLINTLLGDLRSPDVLVVCTALNMVCHLVTADSAATFLAPVTDKLKHRQVSGWATFTLWAFFRAADNIKCHHNFPRHCYNISRKTMLLRPSVFVSPR